MAIDRASRARTRATSPRSRSSGGNAVDRDVDAVADDHRVRPMRRRRTLRRGCRRASAATTCRSFGHLRSTRRPVACSIAFRERHAGGERQQRRRARGIDARASPARGRPTRTARSRAARTRCDRGVRGPRSARRRRRRGLRTLGTGARGWRLAGRSLRGYVVGRSDGLEEQRRVDARRPRRGRARSSASARSSRHARLASACRDQAGSISKLMSMAGAECVSAPTETKSAPVAASSGMRSSVTPPEISIFARPRARRDGLANAVGRHVVDEDRSRRRPRAPRPPARASRPRSRPAARADGRARAATAARTPPARRMWLSLIRIASKSPTRWFEAPPARTAYFSSTRSVGVVLRVSRIVMRPPAASTNRRARVAMPESRCRKLSAVRSPTSSARAVPTISAISSPCGRPRRRSCARRSGRPARPGGTSRTRRRGRPARSRPSSGRRRAPSATATTVASVVMSPSRTSSSSARRDDVAVELRIERFTSDFRLQTSDF